MQESMAGAAILLTFLTRAFFEFFEPTYTSPLSFEVPNFRSNNRLGSSANRIDLSISWSICCLIVLRSRTLPKPDDPHLF
ncbi:MAG: hypothetical protein JWN70_3779 [Planctomycetaceae bacterium]|nr:hypothetical protein [Planctomycetaceae bacterium]